MTPEAEYRINQITVRPGDALGPRLHYHRHEHWVVVAEVTSQSRTTTVALDESIHIPPGQTYRIANGGREDLRLVEIRSGYVGDDDQVGLVS
ncbi:MAG: hypothetical protein LBP55_07350 [Candidatus Adiutrix sp.]|jgi:mannose-6-phosphate isomerase-like protein (cupin superfamily)|nr:hypothetical protein [Candidatus Adiutrix sp.]